MPDTPELSPLIMDLGDFVPEEYDLRLSIANHKYRFYFTEICVDEMFAMLAEDKEALTGQALMDSRRAKVKKFFSSKLVEGDRAQFEADIETVNYIRNGAPFDISSLYELLMGRVKKNDHGEVTK